MFARSHRKTGFTITELLVVIAVIGVLMALLMVVLTNVMRSGKKVSSSNNLRQLGLWMVAYSNENSDIVLPSQVDYSGDPLPGKVRSEHPSQHLDDNRHSGTWADILATINTPLRFEDAIPSLGHDYRYDSPDRLLYDTLDQGDFPNPFRSTARNSRDVLHNNGDGIATPWGDGAKDSAYPGYFAANNFFNADADSPTYDPSNDWTTHGQIKSPDQSLYLIDSFAGETIEDEPDPFLADDPNTLLKEGDFQVDFRYDDVCLILFLDSHTGQQTPFLSLDELEARRVRVRNLKSRL